jgi:glutamine synthetase
MNAKEAIEFGKKNGSVMVDLKFCDLIGKWQHQTVPFERLSEAAFENGFGFDGSQVRGFQPINQSDMLLIPDPSTAVMDPFLGHPTLSLECTVRDPITRQSYSRDPRYIASKAEAYLRSTGIADQCLVGPEAEFFIFDDVRFDTGVEGAYYYIDSVEADWNTGRAEKPNLGHKVRLGEGYFPVPPQDTLHDLRTKMMLLLGSVGIEVESAHHEVATAGQSEIDMRQDRLLRMADKLMWFKYVVKNAARAAGKTATFMPKPIYGDNGSGMHVHLSLIKDGASLFTGEGYGGLSELGLYYMGGVLKHARALAALTNPTVNSYKRLVPGFEAPVNLAYSCRNPSAAIRVMSQLTASRPAKLELAFPDATCNPYLAFAAILMAGLDGIINRIDPGDPFDKDVYSLSPEELDDVPHVPMSLPEAIRALQADHEFLLRGDVFTEDVVSVWVEYKMERDVRPSRMHPTPMDFYLYYDV